MSLLDTGMLGLVKIVGRSTKTFLSKSEMVRQVTTKLSSRLSFFSKVVKEIVVFVPFVPSCLIKASVQNVEELLLSKKVHMNTEVSLLVNQTFTGTTAIAVLKKLASAWVFPSWFTNVLCMHVIASQVDLMLMDGLSTCWPGAAEFVCRTKGCLLVQLEKVQVILLKICWSWEKTALEWWQTVTWNLAAVGW